MQARQFPMQRGLEWLREGVTLWRRNPTLLTFAAFGYLLILLILSAVPLIGQAVASLIMPALSLGVLNTCRAIDEGRKGGPHLLFSGFKTNVGSLVAIGGIYLVASLLVILLTTLIDGGTLMSVLRGASMADNGTMPNLTFSLLAALSLSTPVLMAYWFAPLLAGWWQQPAAKAMFFSFYACLRNWRPFVAFGVSLLVMVGVLPSLLIAFVGAIVPPLSTLLVVVLPLFLVPVVFASFYINARDVFGPTAVNERLAD